MSRRKKVKATYIVHNFGPSRQLGKPGAGVFINKGTTVRITDESIGEFLLKNAKRLLLSVKKIS